jgi:putative transposase
MRNLIQEETTRGTALPMARLHTLARVTRPRIRARRAATDDAIIRLVLHELAGKLPVMGYVKATRHLRADPRIAGPVNAKRVLRLMREEGLLTPKPRPFRPRTTDSRHGLPRFPNLARDLAPTAADRLWVSDITYIELDRGRHVYLALVMDAFTRRVLGWKLESSMRAGLVVRALRQAAATRGIREGDRSGVVVHSDQGSQYASHEYRKVLSSFGMKGSMGEKGDCYDNARAERLNGTVKVENVYKSDYSTLSEAREGIGRYISTVYNTLRLHQALGFVTPLEFERRLLVEQQVA